MADYVIAGSGINALVAASLLALKGRKVLVLERNAGRSAAASAPKRRRFRASPMT